MTTELLRRQFPVGHGMKRNNRSTVQTHFFEGVSAVDVVVYGHHAVERC
jgi:hypothetical protein